MFQQLSLFPTETNEEVNSFHSTIQKSGFDYQELDIGDITFKAGQGESIHRWYRLTPSYSPGLVRFLLKEFEISRNYLVLDPFSGRGTTAIECQKHGIKSLGIEINPVLQQVGSKSLKWDRSLLVLPEVHLCRLRGLPVDRSVMQISPPLLNISMPCRVLVPLIFWINSAILA